MDTSKQKSRNASSLSASAPSASPAIQLGQAISRKKKLESDMAEVERQIYELETSYLEETAGYNVPKGWNGFVKIPVPMRKQEGSAVPEDRIFSLSSCTSPLGMTPWPESLHSAHDLATSLLLQQQQQQQQQQLKAGGGGGSTPRKQKK